MIQIKFKNLERSELARDAAYERVEMLIEKFPDLRSGRIQITFEMENSPTQAGPDRFKVKFHVSQGRYKGVTVEKSDLSLYVALAEVVDHMLEVLNRFGDRARVRERKRARDLRREIERRMEAEGQKVG